MREVVVAVVARNVVVADVVVDVVAASRVHFWVVANERGVHGCGLVVVVAAMSA